jgi:hypothetical protein
VAGILMQTRSLSDNYLEGLYEVVLGANILFDPQFVEECNKFLCMLNRLFSGILYVKCRRRRCLCMDLSMYMWIDLFGEQHSLSE